MIKLGEAYFDEASIVMIMPCSPCEGEKPSYWVRVIGGWAYRWIADEEEVRRTLEDLGMIAPQSMSDRVFTASELGELAKRMADGYRYAAKDEDGRVYAYEEAPTKGKHSWINDDDRSRIAGMTAGEYAALSFADEFPLDITVALEMMLRC